MEEVETYRYLVVDILSDGGMDGGEPQDNRSKESMGSIERLMEKRHISREAKVGMYEGISIFFHYFSYLFHNSVFCATSFWSFQVF